MRKTNAKNLQLNIYLQNMRKGVYSDLSFKHYNHTLRIVYIVTKSIQIGRDIICVIHHILIHFSLISNLRNPTLIIIAYFRAFLLFPKNPFINYSIYHIIKNKMLQIFLTIICVLISLKILKIDFQKQKLVNIFLG